MHEDVPLENKIITTVDQLPSCPRKNFKFHPTLGSRNYFQGVSVLS